ncbi:MAG: hypothetical protein CTY20_11790 [Hyphomicrobium sp.]|nr:MAG: hypothetical protein CTY20_11790 [Hyphomicrobium sp.]
MTPRAPRLDVTLVAFAMAGLVVGTLAPRGEVAADVADSAKSYAIAIASGDAMTLATDHATAASGDAGSRVLACRHVFSVGFIDIGQRCKPSAFVKLGAADSN